ncbi:hypothetical protein M406DRAFT_253242 [Cryphonectria parasitica EP155]|uniref:Ion transport domain-containing protein n=1 Tax=Cryphonectria parasitica (strain ATCC 38755 / EP155) TaxID=660469 RepID=A0A9P4Y5I5_CRYP1|nr:uncharacterized protein M406DRAFT_253242 [Cryphonectria parasitica EP155]KAF3766928.1 hypothetical protein M406DRAFT_253242 [Cryphonectria parasitica EP155]
MAPRGWIDWRALLGFDGPRSHDHWWQESRQRLLPRFVDESLQSAIPPVEVTKTALRLRHLVEEAVPVELSEDQVTQPHSKVITKKVIAATKEAGGRQYGACVVFGLLVCKRWFKHQSVIELWDCELHTLRATACEVIAKALIEGDSDNEHLMHDVLLKRYSIILDGEATNPCNVIEKAVDLHALRVIGSSGYQKCVSYLWKGWLVQDEDDPASFVEYKGRDDTGFLVHLDPDRMRAPMYQNAAQVLISLIYLGLYTGAINSINRDADLDFVEGLLYIFTLGFVFDEISKGWKAGYQIYGFWTAFNFTLYGLLTTSLIFRFVALSKEPAPPGDDEGDRERLNIMSYNFLACCAPMFWMRLLLYLDSFRFFGAMLVVLKVMMKESIIFFALLLVIIIGFLQAFIGLDLAEDNVVSDSWFIIQQMANSIMQSPDFSNFEKFGHPFGLVLYYIFTFVVMVVLLNILIALYNSAYEDINGNANDEYLALFAQKTLQFVRAPDENVFIAPFNLIEVFLLLIPFEWWMPKRQYERLNDIVMGVIYSPLLVVAAVFEMQGAREIRANRARGEDDEDTIEEWEQMDDQVDFEADGWKKTVNGAKTDLQANPTIDEVQKLRADVERLTGLVLDLTKALGKGDGEKAVSGFSRTSTVSCTLLVHQK